MNTEVDYMLVNDVEESASKAIKVLDGVRNIAHKGDVAGTAKELMSAIAIIEKAIFELQVNGLTIKRNAFKDK